MSDNHRVIRIAITEPAPGWWSHVKQHAHHNGTFVSTFVIRAVQHYIQYHSPELPPPVGQGDQNDEHKQSTETPDNAP